MSKLVYPSNSPHLSLADEAVVDCLDTVERALVREWVTHNYSGASVLVVYVEPANDAIEAGSYYLKISREPKERAHLAKLKDIPFAEPPVDYKTYRGRLATLWRPAHGDVTRDVMDLHRLLHRDTQSTIKNLEGVAELLIRWNPNPRLKSEAPHRLLVDTLEAYRAQGDESVQERLYEALKLDDRHKSFSFEGRVLLPNPLGYLSHAEWWQSDIAGLIAPLGNIHNDLHLGNIIAHRADPTTLPDIIDFVKYQTERLIFFDWTYLEFSILHCMLLPRPEEVDEKTLHAIFPLVQALTRAIDLPTEGMGSGQALLVYLLQPLRQAVKARYMPAGQPDAQTCFWLAATAAGLNMARKEPANPQAHAQRVLGVLYAAHALANVLKAIGVDYEEPGAHPQLTWEGVDMPATGGGEAQAPEAETPGIDLAELINRQTLMDALRSLHRVNDLEQSPLTRLQLVENLRRENRYSDTPAGRGRALHDLLRDAIGRLRPPGEEDAGDKRWRSYLVTHGHYIEQRQVKLFEDAPYYMTHPSRDLAEARDQIIADLALRENEAQKEPPPPPPDTLSALPTLPQPPRRFVGRHDLTDVIPSDLEARGWVMLVGMGGIGKSALAAWVAQRYETKGRRVLWLTCGDRDLQTAFYLEVGRLFEQAQAVEALAPAERPARVYDLLQAQRVDLLVLDDVWDQDELQNFAQQAPPDSALHVLITARRHMSIGVDQIYHRVQKLDPISADDLFRHHAKLAKSQDVRRVGELLDYHPLALQLAGSLVMNYLLTSKELEDRYLGHVIDEKLLHYLGHEADRSLWGTMKLSYSALQPPAQELFLRFGALARGAPVSFDLLAETSESDSASLTQALDELRRFSLVEIIPDVLRSYRMHDLSQAFALALARQTGREEEIHLDVLRASAALAARRVNNQEVDALLPDVEHLLRAAAWGGGQDNPEAHRAVHELGLLLWDKSRFLDTFGYHERALPLLEAAKRAAEALERPKAAAIHLKSYAHALTVLDRHPEALKANSEALALAQQAGDPELTGRIYNNQGCSFIQQGKFEDAAAWIEKALPAARQSPDDGWHSSVLSNLGIAYMFQKQIDRANAMMDESLNVLRRANKPEYEDAEARTLNNRGLINEAYARETGDHSYFHIALGYYKEALEFAERRNRRAEAAIYTGNIGGIYRELDQLDAADEKLTEALKQSEAIGAMGDMVVCNLELTKLEMRRAEKTDNPAAQLTHLRKADISLKRAEKLAAEAQAAHYREACAELREALDQQLAAFSGG